MLVCPIEDVKIEKGAENLVHYKWNTKVATHHFCSKCEITTHHQRRTTPEICGISVSCFDEINYCSVHDAPMNKVVARHYWKSSQPKARNIVDWK